MTLSPPAKVNLTLDVGPLADDGYHPIRTVFQAVDVRDELSVEVAGGTSLPRDNLVVRALKLIDPGRDWGATLIKRIPMQAGLGGGSSDAAAALIAGAALNGSAPSEQLAVSLGSDVPFFLVGGASLGEGRGERLTALPDLPEMWFCLAKPDAGMSTPEAYSLLDASQRAPGTATAALVSAWAGIRSAADLAPLLSNDFQPVGAVARPDIAEAISLVSQGSLTAVLCGSGSCAAGLCEGQAAAQGLSERMAKLGYWSAAVRTLRRDEWP